MRRPMRESGCIECVGKAFVLQLVSSKVPQQRLNVIIGGLNDVHCDVQDRN